MSLYAAVLLTVFRMVVIPVQFEDRKFVYSETQLKSTVQQAEDYFNAQPGVQAQYIFDLAPTVSLPKPAAYYGSNYSDRKDVLLHQAVREACARSDIDFSRYDNNSDGSVDNVFIITAGPSEADGAGEDWIWPQHSFLKDHGGTTEADGKTINSFCVCPELTGIGIFCHEFCHVLGLADLYDTDGDGSGGLGKGLWGTGIMDDGSKESTPPDFNAVDLEFLGLGQCGTLGKGSHTLSPPGRDGQYLKAWNKDADDFFLFECKEGLGLAVYHIDRSGLQAGWSDYYGRELTAAERWGLSQVNCRPDRQCAALLPANPDADGVPGLYFPQGSRNSFSSDTTPAFRYWDGSTSPIALTDIRVNPDGSVSFEVREPIVVRESSVFQNAAILSWAVDRHLGAVKGYEIEWSDEEDSFSSTASSDASGFTLTGLKPQTRYGYTVRVHYENGDSYSVHSDFVTKFYRDDSYPYIYLKGSGRKADGRFEAGAKIPLHVFNAPDAIETRWYFNGRNITAEADGYFTITQEGTLKAEMILQDGTTEILVKEIKL